MSAEPKEHVSRTGRWRQGHSEFAWEFVFTSRQDWQLISFVTWIWSSSSFFSSCSGIVDVSSLVSRTRLFHSTCLLSSKRKYSSPTLAQSDFCSCFSGPFCVIRRPMYLQKQLLNANVRGLTNVLHAGQFVGLEPSNPNMSRLTGTPMFMMTIWFEALQSGFEHLPSKHKPALTNRHSGAFSDQLYTLVLKMLLKFAFKY